MQQKNTNKNQETCWYAIYTKSRHECKVEKQLLEKGIQTYLPMHKVLRKWSDRKKWIQEPLFRSYLFIHADPVKRYTAVQAYGAVRVISFQGKPVVVPDEDITRIQNILCEAPTAEACLPVSIGDEVEVIRGPLIGLRGNMVDLKNERRLVISVPSIQQALHFNVDMGDVRILTDLG